MRVFDQVRAQGFRLRAIDVLVAIALAVGIFDDPNVSFERHGPYGFDALVQFANPQFLAIVVVIFTFGIVVLRRFAPFFTVPRDDRTYAGECHSVGDTLQHKKRTARKGRTAS